ncbi:MAG: hypothetical protein ACRELY_26445 [Polyangiaceae bacterium]
MKRAIEIGFSKVDTRQRRLIVFHMSKQKSANADGRPRGRFDDRFDWKNAEKRFHAGVPLATIARDMGCSRQNVWRRATRERWSTPSRQLSTAACLDECSRQPTTPPSTQDAMEPMEIVDEWLALFRGALASGRVRHDAIADLAAALKLKQALVTETRTSERRSDLPTLEQLQERHRRYREQNAEIEMFPGLAGILQDRSG